MQNWKIKRMSYQELRAQSKAVGSLLYYYQRGKKHPSGCPLCDVAEKYHIKARSVCDFCLWRIIKGEDCCAYSMRKFEKNRAYLTHLKKWHKARIPMLGHWKRILQTERDSRTAGGGK